MHKLHVFLHMNFNDRGGWEAVFSMCAAITVLTVDQGTESGLPKLLKTNLTKEFMPKMGEFWEAGEFDEVLLCSALDAARITALAAEVRAWSRHVILARYQYD